MLKGQFADLLINEVKHEAPILNQETSANEVFQKVLFGNTRFSSLVENGQVVVGHSVGFYFQCCVYDEWQPGRNYANILI